MSLNNPIELTQFLRATKVYDKEAYKQVVELANHKPIHIYQIGSITKMLFLFSRFQVYFYGIGGLGYMSVAGYEKYKHYSQRNIELKDSNEQNAAYKQDRVAKKLLQLKVASIMLVITSGLGIYATLALGKRLPKSVYYIPQKGYDLRMYNAFWGEKRVLVGLGDLKPFQQKGMLNQTVDMTYNNTKLSTVGTGSLHRGLMQYLLESHKSAQ